MDGENISELRVQLMPKTRRRMDAQKEEGVMAAINPSEALSAPSSQAGGDKIPQKTIFF